MKRTVLTLSAVAMLAAQASAASLQLSSSTNSYVSPNAATMTWNYTATYWTNGSGNVAWTDNNTLVFAGTGAQSFLQLAIDPTVTGITVNASQNLNLNNISGAGRTVTLASNGEINIAQNRSLILQGSSAANTVTLTGTSYIKTGLGTLQMNANSILSGSIDIQNGALTYGGGTFNNLKVNFSGTSNGGFYLNSGTATNSATIIELQGTNANATVSANTTGTSGRTLRVNQSTATTYAGRLTNGNGGAVFGLIKDGTGTLTLSGSNSYTGTTTVTGGTLALSRTGGAAMTGTTNVIVSSSAILLISQSNQLNDAASMTLSGGTIQRASGVSEVFGNLTLSSASFLDFGTGTAGTITFGTYTPSSLLTVQNFLPGNVLKFGSDLTSTISDTNKFQFSGGFTSSWSSGSSTFTITAVPEASTMAAAAVLLFLCGCPFIRRLAPKTGD